MDAPIGRPHHVVLDSRDPHALAAFYSALFGRPVTYTSEDWVVVAERPDTSGFAFQLAPDHQPPLWGDPARPQQWHVEVMVDDVETAERRVADLGATRLQATPNSIWADPSGHPFCLIPRPGWAPPVGG